MGLDGEGTLFVCKGFELLEGGCDGCQPSVRSACDGEGGVVVASLRYWLLLTGQEVVVSLAGLSW